MALPPLLLLLLLLLVCRPLRGDEHELVILHSSNIHSHFITTNWKRLPCFGRLDGNNCTGGVARAKQIVVDEKAKDATQSNRTTFYFFSGGMFRGTSWYQVGHSELCAQFINVLKPDAIALSHTELNEGSGPLMNYLKALQVPVLAANLNASRVTGLQQLYKGEMMLKAGSLNVGVVGYNDAPDEKSRFISWGLEIDPVVTTVQTVARKLLKEGAHVILALGSATFETEKKLAREVFELDAVLGGADVLLYNGDSAPTGRPKGPYPFVVLQKSGKRVPVIEVGELVRYTGRLSMIINERGYVTSFHGQPIFMDHSVARHPEVTALIDKWMPQVLRSREEVVGRTSVLLEGKPEVCCKRECNLGSMMARAMVERACVNRGNQSAGWTDASIAVFHCGGIIDDIDTDLVGGEITNGHLMNALVYNRALLKCRIVGEDLLSILESAVVDADNALDQRLFLQVSGIRVRYDLDRPVGSRVVQALARCAICDVPHYSPINRTGRYTVIAPYVLMYNNPAYPGFSDCKSRMQYVSRTVELLDWFLKRYSPVFPEEMGQVIVQRGVSSNEARTAFALGTAHLLVLVLMLGLPFVLTTAACSLGVHM